jgi:hypothetical protein
MRNDLQGDKNDLQGDNFRAFLLLAVFLFMLWSVPR